MWGSVFAVARLPGVPVLLWHMGSGQAAELVVELLGRTSSELVELAVEVLGRRNSELVKLVVEVLGRTG